MRFHLGPVPDEFAPDDSWLPIREPGPVAMQFIALPIGVALFLGVGSCWLRLRSLSSPPAWSYEADLFLIVLLCSFPVLIVVHEFLHALATPRFGGSPATIIGAWPRRLLFYTHYSGPLSRDRFLVVIAAPFLAITVLPLALAVIGILSSTAMLVAGWFSAWNAFLACADCLGFTLILFQVPRTAIIRNKGWRTYWKPA